MENLKTMIQASQKEGGSAFRPLTEQVLSPQIFFTQKVVEMAREIDNQWKTEHLSASYIRQYAQEKNLWLVAVLNAWGEVIFMPADRFRTSLSEAKRPAMKTAEGGRRSV